MSINLKEEKPEVQPFVWTEEHQASVNTLKQALAVAVVLSYQHFSKEFALETNASLKGLGADLSQVSKCGKTVSSLVLLDPCAS